MKSSYWIAGGFIVAVVLIALFVPAIRNIFERILLVCYRTPSIAHSVALIILTLLRTKSTWVVSRICWLSRTTTTIIIASPIEAKVCITFECS